MDSTYLPIIQRQQQADTHANFALPKDREIDREKNETRIKKSVQIGNSSFVGLIEIWTPNSSTTGSDLLDSRDITFSF